MSQIGPILPAHLQGNKSCSSSEDSSDDDSYGPKLPSDGCKGPDGRNNEPAIVKKDDASESESSDDDYGPSLPPHLQNKQSSNNSRILGPSLPASGYSLPGPTRKDIESESDEDDDVIGPRIPSQGLTAGQSAAMDMEERARRMKDKLEGKNQEKEPERESWMLELPTSRKDFGLGARQFSRKGHLGPEKGGDRSAWTDSPAERERKAREGGNAKGPEADEPPVDQFVLKRDMKMDEMTAELNKKRGTETLMDKHSKKLKKKAKKEEAKGLNLERRPFDRDLDLKANLFDEAQRKAMLKKSGTLTDRYATGGQKFL